jgi:hypothetical protein
MHDASLLPPWYHAARAGLWSARLVAFVWIWSAGALPALSADASARPPELLFIGNSHTYANDLPDLVRRIALSKKTIISVDMSANPGWQLSNHARDAGTRNKILSKKWDFVILQEGGSNAPASVAQAEKISYPFARILTELVRKNSPTTQVVLYMIHGYQRNYAWMQERVKINNMNMGKLLRCAVSPCGLAWGEMMKKSKTLSYYAPDGYHPSAIGSYISACVMYATLFHQSTIGAFAPSEIDAATARQIQATADRIVLDEASPWNVERARIGIPTVVGPAKEPLRNHGNGAVFNAKAALAFAAANEALGLDASSIMAGDALRFPPNDCCATALPVACLESISLHLLPGIPSREPRRHRPSR